MKKVPLFLLIILLLLTGCAKKPKEKETKTIIEDRNDLVMAINYPQFQYNKIDKAIEEQVNLIQTNFQKEFQNKGSFNNRAELNIDYQYKILNNRYINVVLKSFISQSNLAHPIHHIYTFRYDKKKNKLLTFHDLISQEELTKLVPLMKQKIISEYKDCVLMDELSSVINNDFQNYQNFTFDDNDLTLYFDPYDITAGYCGIVEVKLPLDQVNVEIPLERGVFQEKKVEEITLPPRIIDPKKPMIALTFDDGPSKYTEDILALLKKYHVNATFFVIGNKMELYQSVMQDLVKNGNEIGNHSYNHKWLTKVTDEELLNQIKQTQEIVKKTTGFTPKVFRPTYGAINKHLRDEVDLAITMWTVDTSDWKIKDPKKIASKALATIKDGDIILMHDTHQRTVEALDQMIQVLLKEGYQFVTVSELNESKLIKRYPSQ